MCMEVDQPRRDDRAVENPDLGRLSSQIVADFRNRPAGEGDVLHGIEPLRRIDNPARLQQQIVSQCVLPPAARVRSSHIW